MKLKKSDIDLFYGALENRFNGKIYYLKDKDDFYSIIVTDRSLLNLDEFSEYYLNNADTIFKSKSYIIKNRLNDLLQTNITVIDSLEEYK